jgi:hypothetical protein
LRVQDVDGDGDQDIVTLNEQRDTGGLRVHINIDGSTFESQLVDSALPRDLPPIVLADLDRDGDDDLVTSVESSVLWYENEMGRFADRRMLVAPGGGVQVVNMDVDDDLEVVVDDGEAIRLFDNRAGTYTLTQRFLHHRTGTLGAEDIDADGDVDIFLHGRHSIDWFENRNDQFIGPLVIEVTQNFYSGIEFVDWDTDGDLDVVRRNGLNWALLENRQVGDINNDRVFGSEDLMALFALGQYEDETDGNSTFATGDWNGDGDFTTADLVLAFQLGHYAESPPPAVRAVAVDGVFAEQESEATFRSRADATLGRVPAGSCDAIEAPLLHVGDEPHVRKTRRK